MSLQKPYVFVSHAASEADMVHKFVDFLQMVLPEVSFFVSSSHRIMKLGAIWWDEIRYALAHAKIILTCVSRQSIDKPWILFESGVGLGYGAVVIPVVLDDLPYSALAPPLSMFQAVRLDEGGLVELIAQKTKT